MLFIPRSFPFPWDKSLLLSNVMVIIIMIMQKNARKSLLVEHSLFDSK